MLAALLLLFCLAVASAGTARDQSSAVVGTEPNNPSPFLKFLFAVFASFLMLFP